MINNDEDKDGEKRSIGVLKSRTSDIIQLM
jgi:hypothetical protein